MTPTLAKRRRRLGWALLLAGALLLASWAAVTGLDLLARGRSLLAHLAALEQVAGAGASSLGIDDVARAGEHLAGVRTDLVAVREQVGPALLAGRFLGWLPRHGGDLTAADDLLSVALGAATAGDRIFQALSPALELVSTAGDSSVPLEIGQDLLPLFTTARPELEAAQRDLAVVAQARARIDASSLSPRVAGLVERLDRYLPWLGTAVDAALIAPEMLGADGHRTYLIMAQNNHELRATGGFISGVGELHVEKGRLVSLTFDDSYAIDNFSVPHEVPPADFQWVFRDTNWDPDFPTSAHCAFEVYARDRGVRANGVVALDLTALESLLAALGPVRVKGISEPVTAKNVMEVLQAQWANPEAGPKYEGTLDPQWWAHRKDFMGMVANAALDKLRAGQDIEPVGLAGALMRNLDEKHILLYLADPAVARFLRTRSWDGALPQPSDLSDMLVVVDSNVGFNKVDPNVARSILYQVDLVAADGPRATLTLTYQNHSRRPVDACVQEARYGDAYADMMDRCYWNYVRVYAPLGSKLLAAPALDLPSGSLLARSSETPNQSPFSRSVSEGNWTAWPGFFALAPGAEQALTFEYELPVTVLHADDAGLIHYKLCILKQPGTIATPLQVEIKLPPGSELVDAEPLGLFSQQGSLVAATTDLRTDREFEIVFRKDKAEP